MGALFFFFRLKFSMEISIDISGFCAYIRRVVTICLIPAPWGKTMKTSLYLFLLFFPALAFAQSPLLPPSHPAYEFLERMETKGLLDYPLLGCKPVTRIRIAGLLDEVMDKTSDQPDRLSRVDRETLAALRWEFARDLERAKIASPPAVHPEGESRWRKINAGMTGKGWFTQAFYRNGINFYSRESDLFDAYVDPRASGRIIQQEGKCDPIVITAPGIRLRGHVQDKLGIYFEIFDYTERGRGPYRDRSQLYQDRYGYVKTPKGENSINYDVANFDLAVGGDFWEMHLAKTPLRWGPGRSGQLLLSDWGTSFHQFNAALNLGEHLRLVYLFGTLKTYPELNDTLYQSAGYPRTIERSKYIAAHRLEWDPHPRLRLGFSEAVVFGERDPELAYLIPVNLFYSAQHALGDEDNTLMAFDASWIFRNNWKIYGELLIDDVTLSKLGSDYFGEKQAWLAGLNWVEPAGLDNTDITFETARIRPFVYTHRYPINTYTHWTAPLGYRYPPNSQVLFFNFRWRPDRRVLLESSWTNLRHGANTPVENAGGDILTPHDNSDSDEAPFLGGDLQVSNRFDLSCRYEALLGLFLWGRGSWMESGGDPAWEWEVGFGWN